MVDCYYSLHLLGAMDRLWFQQIILFPEPINPLLIIPKNNTPPKPPQEIIPISSSAIVSSSSSPNLSSTIIDQDEISSIDSDTSPITSQDDNLENEVLIKNYKNKRPTRLSLLGSKSRCRSSSPSVHKIPKQLRNSVGSVTKLRKTMSCKSLWDLEYEEIKGFMDLGFRFNKEQLCPRMMSVIPGLQRIGEDYKDCFEFGEKELKEDHEVERPYLSEAWLIKRPNSPLLNLRMPPVSASSDMKKHLRFWARTVASAVQLECTD
ncbi:Protein of unknown function DUF1685 [Macleaya cordata]|uniref:Uncharacterized protein n=1 Tax=Macleaya cordata TaxID=56857 RepID=A0A200QI53_MACCD|nr:Protein of unknown function DUF1685 [Macleaya cordata]